MEVIFFRHGEKEHSNTHERSEFQLDSPLKGDQTQPIIRICKSLTQNNSLPDILLCSPISRTRQTAQIVQQFLQENGHEVMLLAWQEFGEYFGWHHSNIQTSSFHPETLNLAPKIDSSTDQFHARVQKGFQQLKDQFAGKRVWVFTHRIVIWSISKTLGFEIKSVPFLGTVGYQSNKLWIRRGNCWIRYHNGRVSCED